MLMPFTDHQNNSYLLKAAQPRKVEDRTWALTHLQNAVKQGTFELIATNTPLTDKLIYKGPSEQFELVLTKWHEDLALEILDLDRERFIVLAQKFGEDEVLRMDIAPEALIHFTNNLEFIGANPIFSEHKKNTENLDTVFKNIQKKIAKKHHNLSSAELHILLQSDKKILKTNQATSARELGAALTKVGISTDEVTKFCSSIEGYNSYINLFKINNYPIGLRFMQKIAERKGIPLVLWQTDPNRTLTLISQKKIVSKSKTINLLMINQFEFSLLIPQRKPTPTEKLSVYTLTKNSDFKNQKNMYLHNILFRAVRSPAADLLLPYILEDLNFKEQINHQDTNGKTPLHRAIRYFSDYRDSMIKVVDYHAIMFNTLNLLLQAGAKADIQDNEKKTAMDLASKLNSTYLFPDKNFNLATWLVERLLEINEPKNVSTPAPSNFETNPQMIAPTTPLDISFYQKPQELPSFKNPNAFYPPTTPQSSIPMQSTPLPSTPLPETPFPRTPEPSNSYLDSEVEELLSGITIVNP